jgi:ketosteroid isomerase-like protein
VAGRPIDVVRSTLDAFAAHDLDHAFKSIHDDAVWDWTNSISPYAGLMRGHDEVRRVLRDFLDVMEDVRWEIAEVVEIDDERVIIGVRVVSRGDSGLVTAARGAELWTVRDGKVAEAKVFQSIHDAQAFVAGA